MKKILLATALLFAATTFAVADPGHGHGWGPHPGPAPRHDVDHHDWDHHGDWDRDRDHGWWGHRPWYPGCPADLWIGPIHLCF